MSHGRRHDSLLPKILNKVLTVASRQSIMIDGDFVDRAQKLISEKIAAGNLSDRDLHSIATAAAKKHASKPTIQVEIPRPCDANDVIRPNSDIVTNAATPMNEPSLLFNTTKRQRLMMADQKWISQAEKDSRDASLQRLQEKTQKLDAHRNLKQSLDTQMSEWEQQKARERADKRRAEDDMTKTIQDAREAARRERENALEKARREKAFRERQVQENERLREEQRIQEHNEQARQLMMIQAELKRQREEELSQKMREQTEWQNILRENDARLKEKRLLQEKLREEDRNFQRMYVENLEKQERDRAAVKARKEARAAMFQQMANTVAMMHMKKIQNVDDKIQAEYEEQQRRAQEDEAERKLRQKQRAREMKEVLDMQHAQLEEKRRQEKMDSKRLAEAMAAQAKEAEMQEAARKQAARAEAARMKEFLSTQLQLQHFKETRPPETSIARPESCATTMYSPHKFTPSPLSL